MELINKTYNNNEDLHITTVEAKLNGRELDVYLNGSSKGYGDISEIAKVDTYAINFLACVIEYGDSIILESDPVPKFQVSKNTRNLVDYKSQDYSVPTITSYVFAMKLYDFINRKIEDTEIVKAAINTEKAYSKKLTTDKISVDWISKLVEKCKTARKKTDWWRHFCIGLDQYEMNLAFYLGYYGTYYRAVSKYYDCIMNDTGVIETVKSLDGILDVVDFYTRKELDVHINKTKEGFRIHIS